MAQRSLPMAASNRSKYGFTLIELLVYISIYSLVTALLLPCAEGIVKVDNRLEMEGFCQSLSAEVTALHAAQLLVKRMGLVHIRHAEGQMELTLSQIILLRMVPEPCQFQTEIRFPVS